MAFGIRNVPDRLKALKEFRRILAAPAVPEETEPAAERLSGDTAVGGGSSSPTSSVLAILELQNPESGLLASASRTFIKCVRLHSVFFVRLSPCCWARTGRKRGTLLAAL